MERKALLISPELCIGCKACQVACKSWNLLPATKTKNNGTYENPPDLNAANYNKIRYSEIPSEKDPVRWLFVSQRCMHCEDAGCMKICSTPGALYRTKDGAVATNKDKCIGCRLCLAGCPFNIPRYGGDDRLSKCTMCADRMENGMIPMCAKTCPTGAISFGARHELIAKAKKAGYSKVYGEKDLGGLGAIFAFRDAPKIYGYDEKPEINQMVILWHKYLKPLSWVGIGGVALGSVLHYFAVGPHKAEPPKTGEEVKKDEA